ncbi:MAG: 16S rRNA (uracil(1498)-N(3))-methyltransferase [Halieaceae bacterium]|jgi:RsmE family RNA methyltransferase|nr:16S rRNA (uracil(1498)-N(3))-methyltransferase [Halieaceae bacterium]
MGRGVNLLLFTDSDRPEVGHIRVTDRRLKHLNEVLKSKPGDRVAVGEIGGQTGSGEILQINSEAALLATQLDTSPPPKLPLSLVLAMPRPKMLRRILRTIAESGVGRLHLINSYRVEKSYWQTPLLKESMLRDYLCQGLEQARDTVLPPVTIHRQFKPFVEDLLPAMTRERLSLLAHPGNHLPCPRGVTDETLLVIGPEGGFIPYEVDKLQQAGCQAVSLGPRILRVENAVSNLLGRLF